ncbi:MAG: hypothetical protein HFF52_02005 [Lawsonibacter sp.]|nr:hypothetical protein [Lawsonibacter sp.]
MGRSNNEVGGYRGRRTATDILKLIAIILGVLVILALAGVVYLQRYLVRTEDGVRLELPPFLQMLRQNGEEDPDPSTSPPDGGDTDVSIQPPGSQSEPVTVPEPEPEKPGLGLQVSLDEVLDGSAAARLEAAGAEVLIVEVKNQEGELAWLSGLSMAEKSKVNGTREAGEALRQWNAGEGYTVALVRCFQDNSAAYHCNSQALHQSNGTWRDEAGIRWLSPARDDAQAYIAGLCGELAALGFDEIVLEHFTFPFQGRVERILKGDAYNTARLTDEMEDLLTQVEQAMAPYGAKLSLRVSRETLSGGESLSGLTPRLMERFAHRLWVEEDGQTPAPADLLEQAGITGGGERLVHITSVPAEEREVFQAVLEDQEGTSGS